MENIKTIFISSIKSDVNNELQAFCNEGNEIFISIDTPDEPIMSNFVCLDKNTAIKFVKHLKREISYIIEQEKGGYNG